MIIFNLESLDAGSGIPRSAADLSLKDLMVVLNAFGVNVVLAPSEPKGGMLRPLFNAVG